MSILNTQPTFSPTAERIANRLVSQAVGTFNSLVSNYERGLSDFWNNPHATPQEISDVLGTNAAELFILHGTIKAIVQSVKPDQFLTDVSSYGTYTINPDGTITIGTGDPIDPEPIPSGSIEEPIDPEPIPSGSIEEPIDPEPIPSGSGQ